MSFEERVRAAWVCLVGWACAASERVRVAWAVAVATYRATVLTYFATTADFTVYKVLAFNDDTSEKTEVTGTFVPGAWEAAVREVTEWTTANLRVEVRYWSKRKKKYRMVLRPGDTCSFAALSETTGPTGVVCAEFVDRAYDGVNVTARVLKYQGPGKDFQAGMGHRVSVSDMFPMDDIPMDCTSLSIAYVDKGPPVRIRTRNISLDARDVNAALRAL